MPPKKNQLNGFWHYAQNNKGKWKAQGLRCTTNQELLDVANPSWKALSVEERKWWDNKAKEVRKERKNDDSTDYERMDNTGQIIATRVDTFEMARLRREKEMADTVSKWKGKDLAMEKIYLVNFQPLCEMEEGVMNPDKQWLPREIAVVKYTLQDGIIKTYHQPIWPGSIPLGFRRQAEHTSEEFHRLPCSKMEYDSSDFGAVFNNVKSLLQDDVVKGEYPPLYCLTKDYGKMQFMIDWLWMQTSGVQGAGKNPVGRVHSLEDLVFHLLRSSPVGKDMPAVHLAPALEGSQWDYISSTACDVHKDLDVSRYCSLAIVRKYAYIISDLLAEMYGVELSERHVPVKKDLEEAVAGQRQMPNNWLPPSGPSQVGWGRGKGRPSPHQSDEDENQQRMGRGKTYAELSQPLSGRDGEDAGGDRDKQTWGSAWDQGEAPISAAVKPEQAAGESDEEDDYPSLQMSGVKISEDASAVGGRGLGGSLMPAPEVTAPAVRPPPGFGAPPNPSRGRGCGYMEARAMPSSLLSSSSSSSRMPFQAGRGAMPPPSHPPPGGVASLQQNQQTAAAMGRGGVGRGVKPPAPQGGAAGPAPRPKVGRGRMTSSAVTAATPAPHNAAQFEASVLGSGLGRGRGVLYSDADQTMSVATRWLPPTYGNEAVVAGGAGRGAGRGAGLSSAVAPGFAGATCADEIPSFASEVYESDSDDVEFPGGDDFPPLSSPPPPQQARGVNSAVGSGGWGRGVSVGRGTPVPPMPVFGRGALQQ